MGDSISPVALFPPNPFELINGFNLDGFREGKPKPKILNTNINRIADKDITIITEYKNKVSEYRIPYTLLAPPYLNPLIDIKNKFIPNTGTI